MVLIASQPFFAIFHFDSPPAFSPHIALIIPCLSTTYCFDLNSDIFIIITFQNQTKKRHYSRF